MSAQDQSLPERIQGYSFQGVLLSFISLFLLPSATLCWAQEEIARRVTPAEVYGQNRIPVYTFEIIGQYPHGEDRYTEGLIIENGYIYESTGLYGHSRLVKSELREQEILQQVVLEPRYFGEGIALMSDSIFQLTYKSGTCFVYDKNTFEKKGEFSFLGEGWGLTTDGEFLIMSNGSPELVFLDPQDFKERKRIRVSDQNAEIGFLNELEYVVGLLYANIQGTHFIAMISPSMGAVVGWLDIRGIHSDSSMFPNGIAYDAKNSSLFVTGKNWDQMYEIKPVLTNALTNEK